MPHIRIADIKLYYEMTGKGDPILFIHGLGASERDWEAQVDYFSNDYQVIAVDIRGHGKSSKPTGPYSMLLFAADTADLITSLGINPCHIIGISLGGMIAFQLAARRPDLIRSMVIINSTPEFIIRTFKEYWQVWQRDLIVRFVGMRTMGKVLSKRLFPKPDQAMLRNQLVDRWAENDPKAYRESLRAMVGWSVSSQLSKMTVPTLVVAGENDYTPVSAKEAYVAQMPKAELVVVPDGGHATPVEQPEHFNHIVESFLTKQEKQVSREQSHVNEEEPQEQLEQDFITYQTELDALNGGH